jgi:hypothetical protein
MKSVGLRKAAHRLWIWIGILTLILWVYPVAYRMTRLLMLLGVAAFWVGALVSCWGKKPMRIALLAGALFLVVLVSLPGRATQPDVLAEDYRRGLRLFRGVRYVWGGEGLLGIDCSGLARQGLIWGQLAHGTRTLNGTPIRNALWLWWNDCSALALRDGFKGSTREYFRADGIANADHGRLKTGDLAITADGVHVLIYLGDRAWIEADPAAHKVLEIDLRTDNPWFHVPVVFVRWK